MNVRRLCTIVLAACLVVSPIASAATRIDATNDSVRIARLAALCKLWGVVKYFHPYLAYKEIDWDGALIRAIPKVDAATSPAEYEAAVASMLSSLDDPGTHVLSNVPAVNAAAKSSTPQPYLRWLADEVAVIVATDHSQFIASGEKQALLQKLFTEAAQKARAVVFDIRRTPDDGDAGSFWFNQAVRQTIPLLLDENLRLPSSRHRMYSGYPTQTGMTSGGYYSAFVSRDGGVLPARGAKGAGSRWRL